MQVVLDTNITVSGLLWGGPPRQIMDAARAGKLQVFTSIDLLEELEDVLARSKLAVRLQLVGKTASALLEEYSVLTTIVAAPPLAEPVSRDPDDDVVLACALAAQAEAIISGDADLLVLGSYRGIPILTAPELLARLSSPATPNVEG